MILKRLGLLGLILGAGLGTAACTDGYGYSGVSVGYGTGYYDGYGDPYGYGGYGYGYPSYYGWYGDYYYPGTGVYVYDRYRRPYRWNDGQRRYWEGRRGQWRGDRNFQSDWRGFNGRPGGDGRGWNGGRPGGWDGRRNFSGTPQAQPQATTPGTVTPRGTGGGRNWGGGGRGWGGGNRGGGGHGGWHGRR
ncbi:hypothetical protein D9601_15500 [Sphingomonas sp. MA1305]|uniref:hypothetical protein n=1 Tax=unclassified Sphingomonas TaxID=196159 RepID=UPI0018E02D93|nr:hypothetical protein [Sphingomonas sp. MA1305]MBI0476755.1 hypothetical protein [Sphingomonas sp. MA1305]